MRERKKHCNTCRYAYDVYEKASAGIVRRQKCRNPAYNAPSYTHDMLMEDWDQGYCRFWAPK